MLGPIFDAFNSPLNPLNIGLEYWQVGGGTFYSKMPFLPSNVLEMHLVPISKVFEKSNILYKSFIWKLYHWN